MSLTPSQRPTREGPLLVVTVALVGIVCFPLWQRFAGPDPIAATAWTQERWAKLLLGPEQIVCYVFFVWSVLIFLGRYWEVRRQRRAFGLAFLPVEEGSRILQEDARPLRRKADQLVARHGPFILANMVRQALAKFAVSRSTDDVASTVKTQAEVDQGRLIAGMSTLNYLAWAIPAVGFFGTVRGLAGSMTLAGQGGDQVKVATAHLTVAFDCTLVALALSVIVMYLIHVIQRDEDWLVTDCQQYCLEHLVNRIYEPEPLPDGMSPLESVPAGAIAGTLSEKSR
ncbi:MAG TPA: MotA/TolQ/ExbB proton channel family protein [Gemmataceae bacterium]|jgi:biopolymer transport protein ExbB/TolQ|nr:MotA/TolQ/ExbB proton channel family protein [Gemmataceae bacterium]